MGFFRYPMPEPGAPRDAATWVDHLRRSAVPRHLMDEFLGAQAWARFDPELGYVLKDSAIAWGQGGSLTVETFGSDGGREGLRYPGRRARINSYGDDFTEGIQVGDGETWQEYLAAHLREPVGNYGVGGYGVYQAYRRMVREESTSHGAPVVILTIAGGSMERSLTRSQWVAMGAPFWDDFAAGLPVFHGNLWPNMELDLDSGRFVQRENPLRTVESLDRMCDPDWIVEAFRDDVATWLMAFVMGSVADLDGAPVDRLAEILHVPFDWDAADLRREAYDLMAVYRQVATNKVLDWARAFTGSRGKKLLVVLNLTAGSPSEVRGGRDDLLVVDHLAREGFSVFDMNEVHRAEHAMTRYEWDDYLQQYLVSSNHGFMQHYNARGHHLFAYALTDSLLGLLEDKPTPYRVGGPTAPVVRDRPELRLDDLEGAEAWIVEFLHELRSRFAEDWGVDSLAQLARRSRSALYREFSAVMKISPMEYVKQLRLDEAARLLLASDATIADIATRVGFASPFHLSREFTRRYGVSPSLYRRRSPLDVVRRA